MEFTDPMKLVLLWNPRSGRGRSRRAAEKFGAALRAQGHEVSALDVPAAGGSLAGELEGAGALLVAGGDGSVLRAAPAAIAAGVPVYHIPCGNENLFAREFRMDSSVQTLRRALERRAVTKVDVGRVTGRQGAGGTFLIMCSLGPDAGVIHRLARARSRALGHFAYAGPVLRELMAPSFPRLRVRVDGREVVDGRCGILLVGNSRQYALRMDPAVRASMSDGLLDVVFLPCQGRAGALAWGLRCRLRRQSSHADLVYIQGREIEIEPAEGEAVYQVDGEAGCGDAAGQRISGPLRLTLSPACLPVLVP